MTDPTQPPPDELDSGWDDQGPAPVPSVLSIPPTTVLAALDEGWDAQPPTDTSEARAEKLSVSSRPIAIAVEAIDAGWEGAEADCAPSLPAMDATEHRVAKKSLSKKDRRKLDREARAHQAARDLENRAQRKASRKELAERRSAVEKAEREKRAELVRERQEQRAASRSAAKQRAKQAKEAKIAPKSTIAPSQISEDSSQSVQTRDRSLNRATRRSKPAKSAQNLPLAVAKTAPKKPAIGPFALFITVVLAASLLSYYFIR